MENDNEKYLDNQLISKKQFWIGVGITIFCSLMILFGLLGTGGNTGNNFKPFDLEITNVECNNINNYTDRWTTSIDIDYTYTNLTAGTYDIYFDVNLNNGYYFDDFIELEFGRKINLNTSDSLDSGYYYESAGYEPAEWADVTFRDTTVRVECE